MARQKESGVEVGMMQTLISLPSFLPFSWKGLIG